MSNGNSISLKKYYENNNINYYGLRFDVDGYYNGR